MNIIVTEAERLLGIAEDNFSTEDINALETFIRECNTHLRNEGEPLVEDAIYDRLYELLRTVKSDSPLFDEYWDEVSDEDASPLYQGTADVERFRKSNPMMSIQTVKSWDDKYMSEFLDRISDLDEVEFLYAYKLNGHGVRVFYKDGDLLSATTRARSSNGRDITAQMRNILGSHNENLENMGEVEIRGELCVRLSDFPKVKELNPTLKSPFSAVASLYKPSSTPEENALLTFQGYRLFGDNYSFATREEEYQEIEASGFETPKYIVEQVEEGHDFLTSIQEAFASFEQEDEDGENDFFCDGIVLEINDLELAHSLGTASNRGNFNVALKVGRWSQDSYNGYVQTIVWKQGKSKLSPVAIVADEPDKAIFNSVGVITNMDEMGILTAQGNYVANIPLYEPKNILILDAYPGKVLHFRYGGEAGVVPQTDDGYLLTDDAIKDRLLLGIYLED